MKNLFLALLIFGAAISLVSPFRVSGLSPPPCYADDSCSEKTYCEFENISRNWPEPTGFHQDCSGLPGDAEGSLNWIRRYAVLLLVLGAIGVPGIIYYKKNKASKRASRNKTKS